MEETIVRHIGRDDAARLAALIGTAELQKSLRRPRSLFSFLMNVVHHGANSRGARAAVLGGLHARRARGACVEPVGFHVASAGRE